MTFRDARDLAAQFGAKLPVRMDHTMAVAECWIDRIEWLPRAAAADLGQAIEEANRYCF
jgi:hypothetical protein